MKSEKQQVLSLLLLGLLPYRVRLFAPPPVWLDIVFFLLASGFFEKDNPPRNLRPDVSCQVFFGIFLELSKA